MIQTNLDSFLSPASIAVVGASSNPNKIGAVPVRYLVEHGYDGELYAINPGGGQIHGRPAFASLLAVNQPIDLAIFAIPASSAEAALDDAIASGVKNIVMFSAGFAETGHAGSLAQDQFSSRAQAAGIRMLGPNCLGFMNIARSVYATFSPVLSVGLAKPGPIGIVSQSGAFGAYAYAMAQRRGVGLSKWITTGNESDIDIADCIAWMASDPDTKIIMAYLEGCGNGVKLRQSLELARAAGKPVVLVKVGRTRQGAQAAASHTAALAGDDAVYDAMFRQCGVWRARSIEEFFDIAQGLAVAGTPVNERLGLLTVSGGVGAMMADDAAEASIDVAPLSPAVQALIRKKIPLAVTDNPVDLTGQVTTEPELIELAARAMLGEADFGSLLIFLAAYGSTPIMQQLQRKLAQDLRRDFPDRVIIFSALVGAEQQQVLEALGCLCFSDPARAIRVLAAMNFFSAHHERPLTPDQPEGQTVRLHRETYNEAEAMDLLASFGFSTVPLRQARSRDDATAYARDLGFPVVMKVLSADIIHKSDAGGVVLNIRDENEAGTAYDRIVAAVGCAQPTAQLDGVLIAPMIRGGIECILGVRHDPSLGAVVMLGSGGINVELMGDIALRLAPVNREQAQEMISELKIAPLLTGARGLSSADVNSLTDAIVRISQLALSVGNRLASLEINPIMVMPEGKGAIALDAVLLTDSAMSTTQPDTCSAVMATLPLFEMARMRAATTPRRHSVQGFAGDTPNSSMRWVNQFTHTRRLRSPDDKQVVTPNNDTLFSNAWLDLSGGSLIIDVPAFGSRYWVLGFLDAWTNPWAYAGRRTTGGEAQRLFVHGPGWDGEIPAGMHVISAPSTDVWIIGRILVDADPADLAKVHALQDRFAIYRPEGAPALSVVDCLIDNRDTGIPDASEYSRVLDIMLRRNPPASPAPQWSPATCDIQTALGEVYTNLREVANSSALGGGWTTAINIRTGFEDDIVTRARVARNWIGTLGIDEAMYIMAEVDARDEALTGERRYVLRFAPGEGPKVDAFWSITLYRRSDCLLVANPINRYSIGDRTQGLRRDTDGGLSIAIQADNPGLGKNWLPTPPGEHFYLTLRLYQPQRPHLEGTFSYPAIERVG